MHLSSAQNFKTHYLFSVSSIIILTLHLGCARPPPLQTNLYPGYSQTLASEPSTEPYGNFSSSPLLNRRAISCDPLPLVPQTWIDLELDVYLKNYPNGDKMTLIEYATSKNAANFVCGLGQRCDVGQMCYPVMDMDWYILYAVQQWNSFNNILFMAIGFTNSLVQATVNSLIATMFPAVDLSGEIQMKQSTAITAGMTEVSGTLMMDLMIFFGSATGPFGYAMNVLNFAGAAGFGFYAFFKEVPKGPIVKGFGVWTDVVFNLANVEQDAHNRLSDEVKRVINSPISSKNGIYRVLKDGAFLSPAKVLPIPQVADRLRKLADAMAMNLIFRYMNSYITQGADDCNDQGINGAWPQPDRLSYCPTRGGPMYNIIRAVDDKSENEIPNANVINDIFGFSTKMIIDISLNCHRKYKDFRHNPYTNGKHPQSEHDDCIFNLPVCDCRSGPVRFGIREEHEDVTVSCREKGHLPI